jgi:hypothetical protein
MGPVRCAGDGAGSTAGACSQGAQTDGRLKPRGPALEALVDGGTLEEARAPDFITPYGPGSYRSIQTIRDPRRG